MLSIDIKVFCDLFCKGGGKGGGQFKGLRVYSRGDLQAQGMFHSFIHLS